MATLAPRLRADGVPVVVRSYCVNIDLADLLVAEKVPISVEKAEFRFEVWPGSTTNDAAAETWSRWLPTHGSARC